ncbi:BSD domain-containing protein 1-like [Xenia sp. Carnegie-2017]|uniref:BSD domain-containing protein 1-like n=1 Tax=Xenia sp. Carnegie-2017 TaxID=2897299 RepID=UPI001F03BB02|nr:BSD domain-containing protein 1-like [Xenia sp. Carnegie-2017]
MAEEENSSWWSSWTNSIVENVKHKTSTALEFVQSDLSEFVSTIHHDTSLVIADSATAVNQNIKIDESEKDAATGKLKQGVSDILTRISTHLQEAVDKKSQVSPVVIDEQQSSMLITPTVYDRTQTKLLELQTNPDTYRCEPKDDQYKKWCENFHLDSKKGEISELLVNNHDVRRLYTSFVPSEQSHSTFWQRYFYKVHEIQMESKRLADIVARANQKESEDWGWDDEDDVTTEKENKSHIDIVENISNESSVSENIETFEKKEKELTSRLKPQIKENDDVPNTAINTETSASSSSSGESSSSSGKSSDSLGKSDSSDSSSWIRVRDQEGNSSKSSSSVVLVNDKDTDNQIGDSSDDVIGDDDDDDDVGIDVVDDLINDDDDDEFDLNEDISNEDVEKLVEAITANNVEEDWEDWE